MLNLPFKPLLKFLASFSRKQVGITRTCSATWRLFILSGMGEIQEVFKGENAVIFSDSAYKALAVALYSACPCDAAVRLVADLVNNVIVVLILYLIANVLTESYVSSI